MNVSLTQNLKPNPQTKLQEKNPKRLRQICMEQIVILPPSKFITKNYREDLIWDSSSCSGSFYRPQGVGKLSTAKKSCVQQKLNIGFSSFHELDIIPMNFLDYTLQDKNSNWNKSSRNSGQPKSLILIPIKSSNQRC